MSTTRRTILGGALAAPFLAQFAGTAAGEVADATLGTVSGGWLEIRWTPQAKSQMDLLSVSVEPIAPATWVTDDAGRRMGIRFPGRSGTGDPSVNHWQAAHGDGHADGGVVVRSLTNRFEITDLRPTLDDGVVSAAYKINGVENSSQSLMHGDMSQGRFLADPVPPGQPQTIRVEDVPVYATPESLDAAMTALGSLLIGPDTVLGHARGEVLYTPPRR